MDILNDNRLIEQYVQYLLKNEFILKESKEAITKVSTKKN